MVRFVRFAVAASVLVPVLAAAQAQAPAPRFAFVDSRAILQRAPGSTELQAQITRERTAAQESVSRLQDSLRTMYDTYLKEKPTLTAAQIEQRERALQAKNTEFDQRVSQMDQDMQQRQFELVQPMMTQIREVLDNIRNEESYLFIFDIGNDPGLIVAADRNLDITDRVVARLKPIAVNLSTRPDSSARSGPTRPAPAGVRPPTRPPTQ